MTWKDESGGRLITYPGDTILQRRELRGELIENGVRDQENELKKLPIKDGNHAKCMLDV